MTSPLPRTRLPAVLALTATGCGQLSDPMAAALEPNPDGAHQVHAFRSDDGVSWQREPAPVAWGLNSLGLEVAEDGALLVTGLQTVREPPWLEANVLGPSVHGLRLDADGWSPMRWEVDDPDAVSFIDPQRFEGQTWYVAPTGTTGDPAKRATPNPVRSAPPPTLRFAEQGVVDPSPVRVDGRLHLFLTRHGQGIVHLAGEPLAVVHTLPGASVPFAVLDRDLGGDGDGLRLYAQAAVDGKRQPVVAHLTRQDLEGPPGQLRPSWERVADIGPLASCTSPVVGPDPRGGWLMLCVEERGPHPFAPPAPAPGQGP